MTKQNQPSAMATESESLKCHLSALAVIHHIVHAYIILGCLLYTAALHIWFCNAPIKTTAKLTGSNAVSTGGFLQSCLGSAG